MLWAELQRATLENEQNVVIAFCAPNDLGLHVLTKLDLKLSLTIFKVDVNKQM